MAKALTFAETATWAESYAKLLAFNQTDYEHILHLDSDSTVLQNMDKLFFIEPAFVAIPRAYWLSFQDRILNSQLLLLQPNQHEFDRVIKATSRARENDYDMNLLNNLYKDSALVPPYRPYNLLTGEFRVKNTRNTSAMIQKARIPITFMKSANSYIFPTGLYPRFV